MYISKAAVLTVLHDCFYFAMERIVRRSKACLSSE